MCDALNLNQILFIIWHWFSSSTYVYLFLLILMQALLGRDERYYPRGKNFFKRGSYWVNIYYVLYSWFISLTLNDFLVFRVDLEVSSYLFSINVCAFIFLLMSSTYSWRNKYLSVWFRLLKIKWFCLILISSLYLSSTFLLVRMFLRELNFMYQLMS